MNEDFSVLKNRLREFQATVKNEIIPKMVYDNKFGVHPEGLALYNASKKLCFVMMPKNASTTFSLSTMFFTQRSKWRYCNFLKESNLSVDKFIVILRDPIDRFISATNMFLSSTATMLDTVIKHDQLYTEDAHYTPQYKFIQRVPKDKIDFFYFNNTVINSISDYYDLELDTQHHHNSSKRIITAVDDQLIKTLYNDDYKLISNIKFVNMP